MSRGRLGFLRLSYARGSRECRSCLGSRLSAYPRLSSLLLTYCSMPALECMPLR